MRLHFRLCSIVLAMLCFITASFLSRADAPDNLNQMNLDKATREVDREVIPDNFQWVVRKKSDIRKEDGQLIEDPDKDLEALPLNETADALPPCAPCTIKPRKVRQ